jgi:hypothetical protein
MDRPMKPAGKISPTEALGILLATHEPHAAAARLTKALHANECRLWCNGNLRSVDYIAMALKVVARQSEKGHWYAEVVSSVREPWDPETFVFAFDDAEVHALSAPKPGPENVQQRRTPVQRKHAGGRPQSFDLKRAGQLQLERSRYEKTHPGVLKKDVEQHLQNWAKGKLGIIASGRTIWESLKKLN